MNRTKEEVRAYFEERPLLKKSINYITRRVSIDDMSIDAIIDVMSLPGLKKLKEIECFKKWIIGDKREEHIVGYKGFKRDLSCIGFQYEIGKEYENTKTIWACENGFHACQFPLDVLRYYGGFNDRYCIVEQWGFIDERDKKRASSNIKIVKEISLRELFEAAGKEMGAISGIVKTCVGVGNWKRVESLFSPISVEGCESYIIIPNCLITGNANVIGNHNVIGIIDAEANIPVDNNKAYNIFGDDNKIYVFGNTNRLNITGRYNNITLINGSHDNINITGNCNHVQTRGKVNVTCIGNNNEVDAGVGSRVNLINGEDIMSSVVKEWF